MSQNHNHKNHNQNNGGNNKGNNGGDVKRYGLLDVAVEQLRPVNVGYNVTTEQIETFTKLLFTKRGIDGVLAAKIEILATGHVKPSFSIYLFLDRNSSDLSKAAEFKNINPAFAESANISHADPSHELKDILSYVGPEDVKIQSVRGRNFYMVELDPISILAVMLAVEPDLHHLYVTNISEGGVVTVIKQEKHIKIGRPKEDQFARAVRENRRSGGNRQRRY